MRRTQSSNPLLFSPFVVAFVAVAVGGCGTDVDDGAASPQPQDKASVEAARADLDQLYKGDYRRAFVDKDPELFLRHIADDFSSTQIDGTKGDAEGLRTFFPLFIQSIERVIDHTVVIEDLQLKGEEIEAVVTLTTVMDRRSQANVVYSEISVGTYLDRFVRAPNGDLLEIAGDQLRASVIAAPRP